MESSAAEPEEAVASVGTLLDGEDPARVHLEDPEHWVAVYSELSQATYAMIDVARERLVAKAGANQADARLIEREIAALLARAKLFDARLRWWARRGSELWTRAD